MVIFIFGVPFPFQSQLVFIRHPGNLWGLKAERDEYASERDRTSHGRTVSFGLNVLYICMSLSLFSLQNTEI